MNKKIKPQRMDLKWIIC